MHAPKYDYLSRQLQRRIRGLRETFKECKQEKRPGKHRFAHRNYLKGVYDLFAEIGAGVRSTRVARRLIKLYGVPAQGSVDLIRAIIDASADKTLDQRMASCWFRALKFIWSERQNWTDWHNFVCRRGGIRGCAGAIAAMDKGNGKWSSEERGHPDPRVEKDRAKMKEADKQTWISRRSTVITTRPPSAKPKVPSGPPTRMSIAKPKLPMGVPGRTSVTHLNPFRHQDNPFRRRKVKTRLWRPDRLRHQP